MITNVKDSIDSIYTGVLCDFEELSKWPNETDVQRRANEAHKKLKEAIVGHPRLMIDAMLLHMIGELLFTASSGKQTREGRLKVLAMFTEMLAANTPKTK
jgi:hypothetical protein